MVICGIAGYLGVLPIPEADTLRLFLSGVAIVQASLVAIVFSVTILAIQMTSDRYTMRIGPVFYRHPVFQITLTAFLLSIIVDLGLLFNVPHASHQWYSIALFSAIGLAVGNAPLFITYIRTSIRLNTPERAIEAIAAEVAPLRYFSLLERDSNNPETPP